MAVPAPAEPTPTEPARPVLSPEESAALKSQSGDLLAGLLTLQDELTRLNVATWAAEEWAKYQQLSEAGDNAFLADDFSTSAASYSEAKALGEALIARAARRRSWRRSPPPMPRSRPAIRSSPLEQYDIVLAIEPDACGGVEWPRARRALARSPSARAACERGSRSRRAPSCALDLSRGARRSTPIGRPRTTASLESTACCARPSMSGCCRPVSARSAPRISPPRGASSKRRSQCGRARAKPPTVWHKPRKARSSSRSRSPRRVRSRSSGASFGSKRSSCIARCSPATARCCSPRRVSSEREARAGLDAKLTNLIDNPTLLFGDSVLADARALLESASAEAEKGPRLTSQIEQARRTSWSSLRSPSPCGSSRIS